MQKINFLVKSSAIVFGVFLFVMSARPVDANSFVEGTGNHFEVQGGEYLNVVLDSSEEVKVYLDSVPQIILLYIEPTNSATATNIILSGLEPSHTYYKYQDDYHNLTEMISNASGQYSYVQDLSTSHLIFIQPTPSTKFISDNPTGGDCTTIGNWNSTTKTCTLTGNVNQTIQIDSNGITLDGAGYTNTGSNTGFGVNIFQKSNATVKNLHITQFSVGIEVFRSTNMLITGNNITSNEYGIHVQVSNATITGNNIVSNVYGISISASDNLIENNNVLDNIGVGVSLNLNGMNNTVRNNIIQNVGNDMSVGVAADSHCNNIIEGNIGSGDLPIKYINSNITFADQTVSELILCNADGATIRNVLVESPGKHNGIFMLRTDNAIIEDSTSSDNSLGIYANRSTNNHFRNNALVNNSGYGIGLSEFSANNEIVDNNIVGNSIGIYSHSSSSNTIHDNTITQNWLQGGIRISFSSSDVIYNNTIANNLTGITLGSSSSNTIYNNNFIQNSTQFLIGGSSSNNIFNLSVPTGGNYWSDYDIPSEGCNNINSDNFCDTPYIFSGGQDNLPWTNQNGWLPTPTMENIGQFKADETTEIQEGAAVIDTSMTFKAIVTSPFNSQVKLQIELRRMNEFNGEFLNTSTQESVLVNSGTEVSIPALGLIDGNYHWQVRVVDAQNNASAWQEFGQAGNIDFIVNHLLEIAVILAEPSDIPHQVNAITAQPCKLFNTSTYPQGHDSNYYRDLFYCVNNYYNEVLRGSVEFNSTIFDNNSQWYKFIDRTEHSYDGLEDAFVADTISLAGGSVQFTEFDIIIVIHSGTSEQRGGASKLSTQTWTPQGQPLGAPPYKIIVAEDDLVGAWAHEIGHIAGEFLLSGGDKTMVPDLYEMGLSGGRLDFLSKEGQWDLMARGSWNEDGNNPPYLSSYTQEFLKLLRYDVKSRSAVDNYTIKALERKQLGSGVLRFNLEHNNSDSVSKYYIFESRDKTLSTWDSSIPKSGLVTYYVDTHGFPEYSYTSDGGIINQCRTLAIPPGGVLAENGANYLDPHNGIVVRTQGHPVDDSDSLKISIENLSAIEFFLRLRGLIMDPTARLHTSTCATEARLSNSHFTPPTLDDISFQEWINLEKDIQRIAAVGIVLLLLFGFLVLRYFKSHLQNLNRVKKVFVGISLITYFLIIACLALLIVKPSLIYKLIPPYYLLGTSSSGGLMNDSNLMPFTGADLDLHVYTDDGRHVGVNYETGEYELQIADAIVSGDLQNAPEWILIPDTVTNYHYVVSSEDNQRFLDENPDIAAQLTDVSDGYNVYARAFDPQSGIFTSQVLKNQSIDPGEIISHSIIGDNATIEVEPGVADTAGPTITHSSVSSQYILGSLPFTFTYSAGDVLSGLKSVFATLNGNPIASGTDISLTQPGTHTIVITAEDNASNITTETINFTVAYTFGGYLTPVKADGTGIYNLNRTLPIRFQLTDANSQVITSASVQLFLAKIQDGIVGTDEIPLSTSNADTGNNFRVEGNQYIYNLDTGTLSLGTWQVKAILDDGTNHTVVISIN